MTRNSYFLLSFAALVILLLSGCSTTNGIPDGEQLYTGMKGTQYENYQRNDHFTAVKEEMDIVLLTKPNASLLGSGSIRSPFPVGLWIWNAFASDTTAFGHWMTRAFGSTPVLMSYTNPQLHESVGEGTLRKRGYFNGDVNYKLIPQRNPKKMKVQYTVNMGHLWTIDSIHYENFPDEADSILSAGKRSAIIRRGDAFDVAKLEEERQRVTSLFRDNGYYYYEKNNASYFADTTMVHGKVQLRLQMADSLHQQATHKWYIGKVKINLRKQMFEQLAVNRRFRSYEVNYNGSHMPIRFGALMSDISLRPGDLFNAQKYEESLAKINSLGLFSQSSINFTPRDSSVTCDTLDMSVDCTFDKPYDFYVEAYGKGKTSGKYGPEFIVGLTKRNAFRGAELFNVRLHGSYEWQTRNDNDGANSRLNSYEYGAEASLEFPRIVNPFRQPIRKRIAKMRRMIEEARQQGKPEPVFNRRRFFGTPTTTLKAASSVINRAHYFKRHVVSGELTYHWSTSEKSEFMFTPLSISYEYMTSRTDRFIAMEDTMPYLKTSMADQFIPKASFSYVYTNVASSRNPISWHTTLSEASNILSLGYLCFGEKWSDKNKMMFKNPYAQFLKVETNFTKLWQMGEKSSFAAHVNAGIAWSYGNSDVIPYTEQFFVGGANSIRAFNARAIGPGRYRSASRIQSYVEETGDMKLQANLEFRPHLFGNLYGALFLDAGNVWTLHEDQANEGQTVREGAKFDAKNMFRQMALGTGIGIRYDLGYFMLRLDWGIGLHVPYDTGKSGLYNIDSFKDAQAFHLAIGLPF
jgi:hypothetical protein